MYLLFAGASYYAPGYASGGWGDFIGFYGMLDYAIKTGQAGEYDWWHIVNRNSLKIVACNKCMDYAVNPSKPGMHVSSTHDMSH